jgi:hypothetical protein
MRCSLLPDGAWHAPGAGIEEHGNALILLPFFFQLHGPFPDVLSYLVAVWFKHRYFSWGYDDIT